MSNRYLQKAAATCVAAIALAGVVSCGSKEKVPIQEDVTIPKMTFGETITGEPDNPAGDTATQTTPPKAPETGKATPPITTPPQVAVPH